MIDKIYLELLDYYYQSKKIRLTKSADFVKKSRVELKKFLTYIYPAEIKTETIKDYIQYLADNYKFNTFKVKITYLKQFIAWLDLKYNPLWEFDERLYYDHNQSFDYYKAPIEQLELKSGLEPNIIREKLILQLIYSFHLSINELLSLKFKDFNQAKGALWLRLGWCEFHNEQLKQEFSKYFKKIKNLNTEFTLASSLIVNLKGEAYKMSEISKILNKYQLQLNILKRSGIVHSLQAGVTVGEVCQRLNLTRLSANYYSFVPKNQQNLISEFKKFHPLESFN
jgi:site-specific recombinase XerD